MVSLFKISSQIMPENSQQIMCQATYKAKTSRYKIATWSLEFSRALSSFFFCYEFSLDRCNIFCVLIGFCN